MSNTVYITRKLAKASIFRQRLEAAGLCVTGNSLIKFSGIPFKSVPECDWIFFYSKNGVKYFFKSLEHSGIGIPGNVKWAAIGAGTASVLKAKNINVDFTGSGAPEDSAKAFLEIAKGQKVLFPQAENSRQSVQKLLKLKIEILDLIVYKNTRKEKVKIPDCDFVVFTSPMNVVAYFKLKNPKPVQTIVSIGQSTATALDEHGIKDFMIAKTSSESALADVILEQLGLT